MMAECKSSAERSAMSVCEVELVKESVRGEGT
jgi:hypothetical protein